jgi:hypothetical protein
MAKFSGAKAQVFMDSFNDTSIINGTGTNMTTAGQKYFVISKSSSTPASSIPVQAGTFFIAPRGGTQLTLRVGDRLLAVNEERFCKTTASFEFSQGNIDVSDDCAPGANILDGIVTFSGSLAGLFRYDDITMEFDNVTEAVINRFVNIVEDNGAGVYRVTPRDDTNMYILTLLNSGGKTGSYENWLFCPIVLTSFSLSLGNTDAQSKDLSFSKGEGQPVLYKLMK